MKLKAYEHPTGAPSTLLAGPVLYYKQLDGVSIVFVDSFRYRSNGKTDERTPRHIFHNIYIDRRKQ